MKSRFKLLIFGIIVGAVLAFPLGINFGRDDPLLSNPFSNPTMQERVRYKARELANDARERVHRATEPAQEKLR
ncbi:MAG: hypothetical protein V3R65_09945 [Acidiferrobacterales bacterium]